MAIVSYDGFDHYSSQTDLQARAGTLEWNDVALSIFSTLALETGRGGYGRCVHLSGGQNGGMRLGGSFAVNLAGGFIGVAVQATPGMQYIDFHIMSYPGSVQTITARIFCNSGLVAIYNGDPAVVSTPIAATPPNAMNPFLWNFVEFGLTASGGVDMHVNGNSVLSCNTGAAGATFNGFRVLGTVLSAADLRIDDFYLLDTTSGPGTYPCNTFLGDTAVRTLNTAANSSVQWTPLAGTNWQEVGESQFDGDTSYNFATTVGATDLFTFAALPTTVAAVYGVQLTGAYRKQDAGPNTIAQKVISGGTAATGAALNLGLNYAYMTSLFVLDPHTGATWSPAAVNAIIGGYQLAS